MSKTLDQWDTYISEYEQGMQSAQAAYDAMTPAEQSQEAINIAKQSAFLTWLKSERDTLAAMEEQGQTLPATVSITNANVAVRVYMVAGDSTVYTAIPRTISGNPYGQTVITAPHFEVYISTLSWFDGNNWHTEGEDCDSTPYSDGWQVGCTPEFPWATRYIVEYADRKGFLVSNAISGASTPSKLGSLPHPAYGAVPTLREGWQIDISQFCAYALFGSGSEYNLTGDVDTEKPWDYYNDNLIPTNPSIAAFPNGYNPIPTKPDPEPPEMDGEQEHDGDNIEPTDPTGLGGGTGFVTMYAITGAQLRELGQKLWTGFTDLNDYLQNFVYRVDVNTGSMNFADIMQFFISLKAYPCPLGNLSAVSAAGQQMYIGSGAVPIPFSTNLHTVDDLVGVLDCGKLNVPFWFGDYRDYDLDIVLYLPFCGSVKLNPVDVLGGELTVKYYIDFCTGACVAYCYTTTWDGYKFPVASMPGQLGADVPLTATNANNIMARMYGDRLDVAQNIIGGVKSVFTGLGAVASGNYWGAARSGSQLFFDMELNDQRLMQQGAERGAIDCPVLSGGRGLSSFGSPSTAYLQIRTHQYASPVNYADTVGNPASSTVTIGDCTGFCQFVNVDVTGVVTDAADQAAIRQALAAGVYV